MKNIGMVAGGNNLPILVKNYAKTKNINIFITGIKGSVDKTLKNKLSKKNYREFYLTEITQIIKYFKQNNISEVVIVGDVYKAKFKLTFSFIKIILKLLFIKRKYDGILRLIIKEFEKNNIKIIGIQKLIPSLLIKEKILTNKKPTDSEISDIFYGFQQAKKFTNSDKGQAIIIKNKNIIEKENFKGTDYLIKNSVKKNIKNAILIKVLKKDQDTRVDIPVIGINTILNAQIANLSGIVCEADSTIIDNKDEVIKLANKFNIFIIGMKDNSKIIV